VHRRGLSEHAVQVEQERADAVRQTK
jgi:hypothetical protein